MELAFFTLLLKDGADRVSGGVAINDEWFFKTRLSKDRGCADSICYDFSLFLTPTCYRTNSRTPIDRQDSYL